MAEVPIGAPIIDGRTDPIQTGPTRTIEYGGMRFPFSSGEIVFGSQGVIKTDIHAEPVVVVSQNGNGTPTPQDL